MTTPINIAQLMRLIQAQRTQPTLMPSGPINAGGLGQGIAASGPSYPLDPRLQPLYMAPGPAEGLSFPGNINLKSLPIVSNPDGSYSTVNSSSFYDDKVGSPTYGKEVLVRGILGGKRVEDIYGNDKTGRNKAINALKSQYYIDGKHLGAFEDGDAADAYATRLHSDWAAGKIPGVAMRQGDPNANMTQPQ